MLSDTSEEFVYTIQSVKTGETSLTRAFSAYLCHFVGYPQALYDQQTLESQKIFDEVMQKLLSPDFKYSGLCFKKLQGTQHVFTARFGVKGKNDRMILTKVCYDDHVYFIPYAVLFGTSSHQFKRSVFSDATALRHQEQFIGWLRNSPSFTPKIPIALEQQHNYTFEDDEGDFIDYTETQQNIIQSSNQQLFIGGHPGTGKTIALQGWLREQTHSQDFEVILPTEDLKHKWQRVVGHWFLHESTKVTLHSYNDFLRNILKKEISFKRPFEFPEFLNHYQFFYKHQYTLWKLKTDTPFPLENNEVYKEKIEIIFNTLAGKKDAAEEGWSACFHVTSSEERVLLEILYQDYLDILQSFETQALDRTSNEPVVLDSAQFILPLTYINTVSDENLSIYEPNHLCMEEMQLLSIAAIWNIILIYTKAKNHKDIPAWVANPFIFLAQEKENKHILKTPFNYLSFALNYSTNQRTNAFGTDYGVLQNCFPHAQIIELEENLRCSVPVQKLAQKVQELIGMFREKQTLKTAAVPDIDEKQTDEQGNLIGAFWLDSMYLESMPWSTGKLALISFGSSLKESITYTQQIHPIQNIPGLDFHYVVLSDAFLDAEFDKLNTLLRHQPRIDLRTIICEHGELLPKLKHLLVGVTRAKLAIFFTGNIKPKIKDLFGDLVKDYTEAHHAIFKTLTSLTPKEIKSRVQNYLDDDRMEAALALLAETLPTLDPTDEATYFLTNIFEVLKSSDIFNARAFYHTPSEISSSQSHRKVEDESLKNETTAQNTPIITDAHLHFGFELIKSFKISKLQQYAAKADTHHMLQALNIPISDLVIYQKRNKIKKPTLDQSKTTVLDMILSVNSYQVMLLNAILASKPLYKILTENTSFGFVSLVHKYNIVIPSNIHSASSSSKMEKFNGLLASFQKNNILDSQRIQNIRDFSRQPAYRRFFVDDAPTEETIQSMINLLKSPDEEIISNGIYILSFFIQLHPNDQKTLGEAGAIECLIELLHKNNDTLKINVLEFLNALLEIPQNQEIFSQLNGIPIVVEHLNHTHHAVQEPCFEIINKLYLNHSLYQRAIHDAGSVTILLSVLNRSNYFSTCKALNLLENISSNPLSHVYFRTSRLSYLIQLLKNLGSYPNNQILNIFLYLARDEECHPYLLQGNTIPYLLKILKSPKELSHQSLHLLARFVDNPSAAIPISKGSHLILEFLKSPNNSILHTTLLILTKTLPHVFAESQTNFIVEDQIFNKLIKLLAHPEPKFKRMVLNIIFNLVENSACCQTLLVSNDEIMSSFLQLLDENEFFILLKTLQILKTLAPQLNPEIILKNNLLRTIVNISHLNEEIKLAAMNTLSEIAVHHRDLSIQNAFQDIQCIEMMIEALQHPNEQIIIGAINGLSFLSHHNPTFQAEINIKGGIEILIGLLNSHNSEIKRSTKIFLFTLSLFNTDNKEKLRNHGIDTILTLTENLEEYFQQLSTTIESRLQTDLAHQVQLKCHLEIIHQIQQKTTSYLDYIAHLEKQLKPLYPSTSSDYSFFNPSDFEWVRFQAHILTATKKEIHIITIKALYEEESINTLTSQSTNKR